jgi:single-stranded DNA-binding protein
VSLFNKGNKYIEGRIKSRQWQTEMVRQNIHKEIQVTIYFLSTKKMLKTTKISAVLNPKNTNFDPQNNNTYQ